MVEAREKFRKARVAVREYLTRQQMFNVYGYFSGIKCPRACVGELITLIYGTNPSVFDDLLTVRREP